MTLGLLTITHDEPTTLPAMLASVRELVDGPTIAFHIGDQDETAEILADFGAEVHRRNWDDFDGSWTSLFALARGRADRFLYLQANSVLAQEGLLPELGQVPCFMIRYRRGPYEYRLPNLLRGDIEWSINAPVHGTLEPSFFAERQPLEQLLVQESDADGRRPEKLARYLPICERMVAENPDNTRAVFYLARTYFDLGRYPEAIEMYERRIRMGGWDEEVWHAHYMKGLSQIRNAEFVDGRLTLLAAYLRRPTRAEPLRAICQSMYPPEGDLLFIEPDAYYSG
jgi:tetratricopeptide (TPR) repeat protein